MLMTPWVPRDRKAMTTKNTQVTPSSPNAAAAEPAAHLRQALRFPAGF